MIQNSILVLNHKSSVHWARKIWHAGMGSLGLIIFNHSKWSAVQWGLALVLIAVISMAFELWRLKSSKINTLFCAIASPLMRINEKDAPTGLAYYALGVGLTLLFFDKSVALLACCYLFYADPMASLIGVKYGKTKLLNDRSFEGTLAFFNVALLINLLFFYLGFFKDVHSLVYFSFLCAFFSALAEVISVGKYLDDNLVVPLVSGLFITAWKYFFSI